MDDKLLRFRDAIARADIGAVSEMIEQDKNLLNARLPGNITPLMFAAERQCFEDFQFSNLADRLIRMGAKVDIVTAAIMGATNTVRDLLRRQPSLILKHDPNGGYSLLHIGALYGDSAMVELLLEYGIDPNEARQPSRTTPLFFAHRYPYQNAELLLAHGANINARAKHELTVLHPAAMSGDLEWIKFLLNHGADPNAQTEARQSPWMLAVKWKRHQAAALLVEFSRNRLFRK
jgi:ankyrin repeat protein